MKIAFFTTQYMKIGGVENVVREIAKRLSKKHEVYLVTRDRKINTKRFEEFWEDVFLIPKSENYVDFLKKRKLVEKYILENNIDIVNFHNWSPALPFVFSSFPKVITMHGSSTEILKNEGRIHLVPFMWILEEIIMNSMDAVISITKFHLRIFKIFKPLYIIPNGVDISFFSRKKTKGIEKNKKFTGIFVAKLMPAKGLKYLLKIAKRCKDVEFIVVGDGEESYLLRKAPKNVKWVGAVYNKKKLREFYAISDFMIITSINEGLPLVLLEAMAMELPIVATRVGGIPEIVEKAKCGILVEPRDVKRLVNAVKKLEEDERLRKKLGKRGRRYVEKYLSWDVIAKKYERVFRRVII